MRSQNLGAIYAEMRLKLDGLKKDMGKAKSILSKGAGTARAGIDAVYSAGEALTSAGKTMTTNVTTPILGVAAAATYAGMKFDSAMSEVKAISRAVGDDFNMLREQALYLGKTTKFTATEAANGMTMLARAGFEPLEIYQAMPGMLDLAAAGNVELARAADIVSDTMMAFGESADQAGRYANVFAEAAASGNTTVEGLGEAMAYGAASAKSMGATVEATAALMTAFADAGIKGTRAGTTYEAMMRDLKTAALEGGGALKMTLDNGKKLSVQWYDSAGNVRPFLDVLADLEHELDGLTTQQKDAALGQIAQTKAMRGLNILMTRGSDSVAELEQKLLDSEGAAKSMAETMLDNLGGSLTLFRSAMDGAMISFYEEWKETLRSAIDRATEFMQYLESLPAETKQKIIKIAAALAVIGPALMIVGTVLKLFAIAGRIVLGVIKVINFTITVISYLAQGVVFLVKGVTFLITTFGWWLVVIAAVIAAGYLLWKHWDKVKEFFGNMAEAFKTKMAEWGESISNFGTNAKEGFKNFIKGIGESIDRGKQRFKDWVASVKDRFDEFKENAKTKMDETATAIKEFPAKAVKALQKFFFETIPYYIGYGMGFMVRKITEGIESAVEWFKNMPERITTFIVETVENARLWWDAFKADMVAKISEGIDAAVTYVQGLPGRIATALVEFVELVRENLLEFKAAMIERAQEAYDKFVEIVSGIIPAVIEKFWELVDRIREFKEDMWEAASELGQAIWDGIVDFITGLPKKVGEVVENVKSTVKNMGKNLWNNAKTAGESLVDGWKAGMQEHSPSYVERSIQRVKDFTASTAGSLKDDLRNIGDMMKQPELTPSFAGGVGIIQRDTVVQHRHSGTMTVRGVNSKDELVGSVDIVMDEIRRDRRR